MQGVYKQTASTPFFVYVRYETGNMLRFSEISTRSEATSNIINSSHATIKGIRALSGAQQTATVSFIQDIDTGLFNANNNVLGITAGTTTTMLASQSNILTQLEISTCSNIVPVMNGATDIGRSTNQFKKIYAEDIHLGPNSLVGFKVTSNGDALIQRDIIPLSNAVQMIGTSNMHFKEAWIDTIHISQNTLYLGDTPVLGTESDSIAIRADMDQSINVKTSGLGVTNLTSTTGVNMAVSGLNSIVDMQSSGAGGRVLMGATNEIKLNAPTTTISSNLTVQGNLTINGTQFTANVETLEVRDNIIILNKGQTGSGVSAGAAGIAIDRGDAATYQLLFNETSDKFEMGPVGNLASIATEEYVLPKTGGTLTGPLIGTTATFNSLGGTAISSDINSTNSNVAASSAAVKAAYDRVNSAPVTVDASNITSGILDVTKGGTGVSTYTGTGSVVLNASATLSNTTLDGITHIANGGYMDFGPHTYFNNGKRIALHESVEQASNSMQYYGFGISPNTLDYTVPSLSDKHVFSYATGVNTRTSIATIDKDGLTLSGGIYGSAISSVVNSTSSNVAASSAAIKAIYDNINNSTIPLSGGTLTGHLEGTSASLSSNINVSGSIVSTNANVLRNIYANTGIIFRNDGSDMYILKTATNDPYGSWDSTRPFRLNYNTGDVVIGQSLGIGLTTTPTERLHVDGKILITSNITYASRNGTLSNYLMNDNSYLSCVGKLQLDSGPQSASLFIAPGGSNAQSNSSSVYLCAIQGSNVNSGTLSLDYATRSNFCIGDYSSNCATLNIRGLNCSLTAMNGTCSLLANGNINLIPVLGGRTEGIIDIADGGYINFGNSIDRLNGKRIALWSATSNNSYDYYGIGVSSNTIEYITPSSTQTHRFSYATNASTRTSAVSLDGNGLQTFIGSIMAQTNVPMNGINYPAYAFTDENAGTGMNAPSLNVLEFVIDRTSILRIDDTSLAPTTSSGTITLGRSTNLWGQIYSTTSTISTSDDRLKVNESFIENAMTTLNKLRPQIYDKYVNLEYATDSNAIPIHEAGLIAQEVFYDAPELRHIVDIPETADSNIIYTTHVPSSTDPRNDPADYTAWGSNMAGIKYEGFIPYIIATLKEKDSQIQNLRHRIAQVRGTRGKLTI